MGSKEAKLILQCPNGEKDLTRVPLAMAVSIVKPAYIKSSAALTTECCWGNTGGSAKEKLSSLERDVSITPLCVCATYALFEGVTCFLC